MMTPAFFSRKKRVCMMHFGSDRSPGWFDPIPIGERKAATIWGMSAAVL